MNTAPWPSSLNSLHELHNADADLDPSADEDPLAAPPLPRDALRLVIHLVSGLADRRATPLVASFGPRANLAVDFSTRSVRLDAAAARELDAHHRLPLLARSAAQAPSGPDTTTRDLDDVVWDVGQACLGHRLLGAGADAWHQPLVADANTPMRRLLRLPLPLVFARLMFAADAGTFTPAQVQRACRFTVAQTRGLLQACLFLGLVRWHWTPQDGSPTALVADGLVPLDLERV